MGGRWRDRQGLAGRNFILRETGYRGEEDGRLGMPYGYECTEEAPVGAGECVDIVRDSGPFGYGGSRGHRVPHAGVVRAGGVDGHKHVAPRHVGVVRKRRDDDADDKARQDNRCADVS